MADATLTSKASDEEPCELCEGTGEYEEQPCPSCVSRELNEELVKVRAEVERLRAIENAAMRVASSFVKRNNTVDPLTMHKLGFALKNQKPTGNETFDDLLYRIHRELARGHSSAALAVVAAALEHRPLPVCTACDVVTLNQNAQKAEGGGT